MFKNSSTKSKLVVNAILLVSGLVIYVGVWYGIQYVSNTASTDRLKLQEAENVVARATQLEKVLSETQEQRARVSDFILTDDAVVGFIESLEALAKDVGLEQSTDAVGRVSYPGLDIAKWDGLQMVLSVRGTWSHVYQFMSLLEHLPYQATLLRAVIEKEKQKEEPESVGAGWRGDFTLRVLKYK